MVCSVFGILGLRGPVDAAVMKINGVVIIGNVCAAKVINREIIVLTPGCGGQIINLY